VLTPAFPLYFCSTICSQFGSIADRVFLRFFNISIKMRSGNAIHLAVRRLNRSNSDGAELIASWSGELRTRRR
jgi:hypothetical protein